MKKKQAIITSEFKIGSLSSNIKNKMDTLKKPEDFDGIKRVYEPRKIEEAKYEVPKEDMKHPRFIESEIFKSVTSSLRQIAVIDVNAVTAANSIHITFNIPGLGEYKNIPIVVANLILNHLNTLAETVKKFHEVEEDGFTEVDGSPYLFKKIDDSVKTKKVKVPIVKSEATARHPAQVEMVESLIEVGTYKNILITSKLPNGTKGRILERIDEMRTLIKYEIDKVVDEEMEESYLANDIFEYILEK